MPARRSYLPLAGVALLFLLSVAFQIRFTSDSIREQLHSTEYARIPFALSNPDAKLIKVRPEAQDAGLTEGDRPVEIDGRAIRGLADIVEITHAHRAGDML